MVRLGCRPGPLAAVLGMALVLAPPAAAITSKKATKVALRALAPQKDPGPVVVYRFPAKLRAGRTVLDNGPGAVPASRAVGKATRVKVPKLKRAAWLFWADLEPGARFEHDGRMVLVDDRSGKVTRTKATTWWPVVDGKNPAFIPTSTVKRGLIAYSSAPRATRTVAPAAPRQAPLLGADAFANDCMYQMGLERDDDFKKDFPAMMDALSPFGLRTFSSRSHKDLTGQDIVDADGADMRAGIKGMPADCQDILIYIDGHGSKDDEPRVNVGHRFKETGVDAAGKKTYRVISRYVYAQDLVGVLEDNPGRTFKLKIDACYSGRFVEALEPAKHPNLLVMETSSSATEVSWSALGESVRVQDGKIVREGGTVVEREFTNDGRGEFTNGNLLAIQRFTTSQAEIDAAKAKGGSLLARMIERSIELGKPADLAATAGLTHPQLATNMAAAPAPFSLQLDKGYSHEAVGPGEPSRVCGKASTSPAQPGATVHVRITDDGAGGAVIYEQDLTLGADGSVRFLDGIDHYGNYTITVTAAGANSISDTVTVTAAAGTCP